MEAVLALVDRFPTEEMAPGEGPTLKVPTGWTHKSKGCIWIMANRAESSTNVLVCNQ